MGSNTPRNGSTGTTTSLKRPDQQPFQPVRPSEKINTASTGTESQPKTEPKQSDTRPTNTPLKDSGSPLPASAQQPVSGTSAPDSTTRKNSPVQSTGGAVKPAGGSALPKGGGPAAPKQNGLATKREKEQKEPVITASENPGDVIGQLKQTPVTELPAAFNAAQAASSESFSKQRDSANSNIPIVDSATGSAANKASAKGAKVTAAFKPASEKNSFAGKGGFVAPKIEAPAIAEKKLPPTSLKQYQGSGASGNDDAVAKNAQQELSAVHLPAEDIPTDLGPAPTLDLNGEADPNNLATERAAQETEVATAKAEAAKEISNDFGENSIIKPVSHELLRSSAAAPGVPFQPKAALPAKGYGPAATQADAGMAPFLNRQIGQYQDQYDQKQAEYNQKLETERLSTETKIGNEQERSQDSQIEAQNKAQTEVASQREQWRGELDKAEQDFQAKAGTAAEEHYGKIETEKRTGDEAVQRHFSEANAQAAQKKQEADRDAAAEKQKTENESQGFWGWLADKASAAINALKDAVNFIFDKLRAAVKWIFEQAKKLALEALELARKAVVGLIKAFATVLKGLVSIVLAGFPSLRDRILSKIDEAVDVAVTIVNKTFDTFKKVVSALIDAMAAVVDTLLAVVQEFYNIYLDAIRILTVGIIKVLEFILDIQKQYETFKAMIDGFLLIWDHPEILEEKAKEFLTPYIENIPDSTTGELQKALAQFGLASAKHISGILKYLTPSINHLLANWWSEAKKMIWYLIWPFAEGSPLWTDAPKLWKLVPEIWNNFWAGEFSKATDGCLEWMQALNMTVGAFAGWIVIGGAVVGAIIGAFFGGVGAIPGAGAGFEVGVAIGEGIMASMIATESAVLLKAAYDLATTTDDGVESPVEPSKPTGVEEETEAGKEAEKGPRQYSSNDVKTGRDRIQYAYQRIANSGITLGIMVALLILGAIGGKIAQGLMSLVRKLGSALGEAFPAAAEGLSKIGSVLKESKVGKGVTEAAEQFESGRKPVREKVDAFKESVGLKSKKPKVEPDEKPLPKKTAIDTEKPPQEKPMIDGQEKPTRENPMIHDDGKKIIDTEKSVDGKRKLEITEEGECLVCASPCEEIQKKYKVELDANKELRNELDTIMKSSDPAELKTEQYQQLENKLAKFREEQAKIGTYDTKIRWGIQDVDARPFEDKGYWGKRTAQSNPRVDSFERKINPNNESFYVPHPNGGYVQFENLSASALQDGKLILKPSQSFYNVFDRPGFAADSVVKEATRQLQAAAAKGLTVEWLVSDLNTVQQLQKFFAQKNINITVKYYPE